MEYFQLLNFFKYCNEQVTNMNDYQIARTLLMHIQDIQSVSQEKIAQQANISVASVSRFIHKAGFSSFQDFKHKIEIFNHEIRMDRILDHTMRFMRQSVKEMSEELYQDAYKHLQETYRLLDLDKLKQMTKRMKESKQILILGDDHELQDFYTLQIDLMINGIATYLVNVHEEDKWMVQTLNPQDAILYLEVYSGWCTDTITQHLQKARDQGIYVMTIAQETAHLADVVDFIYPYGIPDSVNDGYYSLPFVSRLLSELIYHHF